MKKRCPKSIARLIAADHIAFQEENFPFSLRHHSLSDLILDGTVNKEIVNNDEHCRTKKSQTEITLLLTSSS